MPEYLSLFSQTGDVNVCVRFEGHDGYMPERWMSAQEVVALVAPDGAGFHQRMTFDEWEFIITRYEIDPVQRRLTIVARPT